MTQKGKISNGVKSAKIKNALLLYSGFIASAVMLTVIQLPFSGSTLLTTSWSALAWVALVPFILACSPAAKPLKLALAAYLVSLCYWLGNLYWICPVTWLGWLAFCLYTALLWPMLVFALRFCRMKKIPLFLAAGVLFVGAERLQGLFLGGFFWRFLAHSQYANITLIQISDIFGAAGLSFLIAMVNGLVAELLIAASQRRWKWIPAPSTWFGFAHHKSLRTSCAGMTYACVFLKIAIVCAALIAAVAYGRWRINQSDDFIETGPLVGSVQSNVPQSVKQSFQASEVIFDELMQNSNASTEAGAELVVWPETMVQATLDPRVLKLLDSSHSYKIFDKAISEHSKETAFVLVGAYGGRPQIQENFDIKLVQKYNSAFLYQPNGRQAKEQYSKIHLVLFGEVVPFKKSIPWLNTLLMKFTPYDYDYSLDYGQEYTVFEMTGEGQAARVYPVRNSTNGEISNGVYKFGVMICYEDAVPAIARRFAKSEQGTKALDWLINISNDGWFVRFKDGKVFPSTELSQHTAICVFRAVENRLAIVRSVNTGISCLIDTLGRIRNGFLAGTLPYQAMERKGVAGWFVDRVPIDKRTTFFNKYGQWLDFCCAVGFALLIIVAAIELKVKNGGSEK